MASNIRIINNSFLATEGRAIGIFNATTRGNVAYNNIFYRCDTSGFDHVESHDYNLFAAATGGTDGEAHAATMSGDPFVDSARGDARLRAATAAGRAMDGDIAVDPNGARRGADGTWDRGAFELAAAP